MAAAMVLSSCGNSPKKDVSSIPDATSSEIVRVEPLSWWTGMKMPLQLLVGGDNISACDKVEIEGGEGVRVTGTHKADSPNYLFVDVEISSSAKAGTYYLVFSGEGNRLHLNNLHLLNLN